jgi:hypothetical protein
MTALQWNGSQPPKNSNCPYSVEFTAKPLPSNTLNSMEAGKVQLNVFLKDSSGSKVKDVTASIINLYKIQTLHTHTSHTLF